MIFYYPSRYASLWNMISSMAQERYDDQPPNTVTLLGVYLNQELQVYRDMHPGCKLIIYQLEPLCGTNHWWNRDAIISKLKQADEVWDYDYQNVILLRLHGIRAVFKPFLHAQSVVATNLGVEKTIDVLFFGSLTERRGKILSELTNAVNTDVRIHVVVNVLHPEIDRLIEQSKVIVNIHHGDGVNQLEQPRVGYLLANGKHVVSEASAINYYNGLITEFTDTSDLIAKVYHTLVNYNVDREITIQQQFAQLTLDQITQHAKDAMSQLLT